MQWAASISDRPEPERAIRCAVETLRERLGGVAPNLLVVFFSREHGPACPRIAERLTREFPGSVQIGCSARSVIGAGRELEDGPGLALAGAVLPGVTLHPFHLREEDIGPDADPAAWRARLGLATEPEPHFVLLADPFSSEPEVLLPSLDASFPASVKVGGLASGAVQPGGNALLAGDAVHSAGLVGVALQGNVTLGSIVAQGCRPLGNPMFVTRCREGLLLELDGSAAAAALERLFGSLGPEDQALVRSALFLGVEMKEGLGEYHRGDFLIRNLLGVDRESGGIVVAAPLHSGQVVQFHVRDARTSAEDLEERLGRYRQESRSDDAPGGALLFSCLGRGRHLYGRPNHDSEAFRRHFGELPLAGFFCNGEIGPVQGTTFLHGYTSSFGIFKARV